MTASPLGLPDPEPGPAVDNMLAMLAVVRGYVHYDDDAIVAMWPDDVEDLAVGLAAYAATLVCELAAARGVEPDEVLNEAVRDAIGGRS